MYVRGRSFSKAIQGQTVLGFQLRQRGLFKLCLFTAHMVVNLVDNPMAAYGFTVSPCFRPAFASFFSLRRSVHKRSNAARVLLSRVFSSGCVTSRLALVGGKLGDGRKVRYAKCSIATRPPESRYWVLIARGHCSALLPQPEIIGFCDASLRPE